MNPWTDWPSLYEIAKRRAIENPADCKVKCGECGADLGPDGIVHWQDCSGEWSRILFLHQLPSGEWVEAGRYPDGTDVVAFSF